MKISHKVIIFSNLVLAGVSVGIMQNNAKADTATSDNQTAQVAQVQAATATESTATVSANAADTQTSSSDELTATQVQAPQANVQAATDANTQAGEQPTDQPIATKIDGGVVTVGNQQASLYDGNGNKLSVSIAPNSGWITDQKLSTQAGDTYYRVSTDAYANGNDVTLTFGNNKSGVVRVKGWGAKTYNRNDSGFSDASNGNLAANTSWQFNKTNDLNGITYYQVGTNLWINSNDATDAPAYSNPAGWLQIHNTQIQPEGTVGYDLYNGVEGIKVYLVRKLFGYSNSHTIYDGNVINSVRSFQAKAGLPVTGVTDLATWKAMGYSEDSWYGIDSYIAPLLTNENSSRSDHIEAMITQAKKYIGQPWVSGAASSPDYGVDCSGLVTQAMYAAGIDPSPVGSIQHAQPGHEWNSRDMWADWRMPHIAASQRQRGDLVFFTDPSTGIIWHVGILLDANTMIDSWPGTVGTSSIYSGKGNIAGYARVFS
ncbi:NlpC/P60 family protein [Companilactobacillus ginsenosidimutans]|uniref:NlpC/P60 family protein n=1 Tax=Companilactobacillus ginsenosidimutans TaxID=1007676 RepID=UPI00069D8DE9|nr:NlpC/P60 family protein [Companilactobacillus ginsenosidimutans]